MGQLTLGKTFVYMAACRRRPKAILFSLTFRFMQRSFIFYIRHSYFIHGSLERPVFINLSTFLKSSNVLQLVSEYGKLVFCTSNKWGSSCLKTQHRRVKLNIWFGEEILTHRIHASFMGFRSKKMHVYIHFESRTQII